MKFVLLVTLILVQTALISSETRFVFEMFRHGARAPWESVDEHGYDMFGEKWVGDSELTPIGIRQHYLLGHRNREKFKNFLNITYDPSEIYIISTDINRTIMSAYSQLQGLYPAGSGPVLSEPQQKIAVPPIKNFDYTKAQKNLGKLSLPYGMQSMPIHLFTPEAHEFLLHDYPYCAGAGKILTDNLGRKELVEFRQNFNKTYGDIFKTSNSPRLKNYNFQEYAEFYKFFDIFISDYTDKRKTKVLSDIGVDMKVLNDTSYKFMMIDMLLVRLDDKNYLGQLSMSPTFRKIVIWMKERVARDLKGDRSYTNYKAPKLVMYSGHDTTLSAMQHFLKRADLMKSFIFPSFASSFYVELSTKTNKPTSENDFEVIITFNDEFVSKTAYPSFISQVEKILISQDEIDKFCNFTSAVAPAPAPEKNEMDMIFLISLVFFCVLSISLLIFVVILLVKGKKKDDKYATLQAPLDIPINY